MTHLPGPGSTCSKFPSWMRNEARENEISNRITNGFSALSPIPWQVVMDVKSVDEVVVV